MNDVVIRAEHIGKSYLIGHQSNERYVALRDVITNKAKGLWSKLRNPHCGAQRNIEEFWALKDINFEVKQGDRVGIIGRNGAGKSTLLKILSRITEPTSGKISIKGRVASLLEVGTGFHPELTGRENIFLNGAILGMTRQEIKRKFDEIVNFAEVEKFLDTPVKRYSSGMYVRLAFAVAAHLEPEILIVDEVLAVGDVEFQKKCLGKMEDVSAKEGRTVLFVSHNMAAINSLCKSAIVLANGEVNFIGSVSDGVNNYLALQHVVKNKVYFNKSTPLREGPKTFAKFLFVETINSKNETTGTFNMGEDIIIKIGIEFLKKAQDVEVMIYFKGFMDAYYGMFSSRVENFYDFKLGVQDIIVRIPHNNFLPGEWSMSLWVNSNKQSQDDLIDHAINFDILSDNNYTDSFVDYTKYKHYGIIGRSSWSSGIR